jgi:hypothetical protein
MCDMAGSDEYQGRSGRFDAEDRGWSSTGRVLSGQTIERSSDAMCGLHKEMRSAGGARISWFSLQTKLDGFSRFSLKTDGHV